MSKDMIGFTFDVKYCLDFWGFLGGSLIGFFSELNKTILVHLLLASSTKICPGIGSSKTEVLKVFGGGMHVFHYPGGFVCFPLS